MKRLELVSHVLCPYVQRAAIALLEKDVPFDRRYVDLAARPAWFRAMSPLGKVPLLKVGDEVLFESAVICDYLDETLAPRLHPDDALARAKHRGWVEFASALLNAVGVLYNAADATAFETRRVELRDRFAVLEGVTGGGPYFGGDKFTLVDAAMAPVFRYFDVIDTIVELGLFDAAPRLRRWRAALALRPSVAAAVGADYPALLRAFLRARPSHLGTLATQ